MPFLDYAYIAQALDIFGVINKKSMIFEQLRQHRSADISVQLNLSNEVFSGLATNAPKLRGFSKLIVDPPNLITFQWSSQFISDRQYIRTT